MRLYTSLTPELINGPRMLSRRVQGSDKGPVRRKVRARRTDARMASAISDADCRTLDHASAVFINLLVHGVEGQNGQSQRTKHPGGGRGPRRTANAQPKIQACAARIPAAERLTLLPALVELDLSSLAFHLDMGDDDDETCAFLSTAVHNGRGCQEWKSPHSTSSLLDSLFSQASTASSASSDAVASRTASHSTPLGFDHRLDPDYCFNLRELGPSSPLTGSSALAGQPFAGATTLDYGSNPFDYVGVQGPTGKPREVASRTTSHPTPLDFDYRLDPDYCFDFCGPVSPRRFVHTCTGATPFAYGSTPFD